MAITITIAVAMINIVATAPPIMKTRLWGLEEVVGAVVDEHSPSLRDEIATEHSGSTVIRIPVTDMLGLPLTHFSIREMSESLFVSEVPSSLARYVTYVWEFGKQFNVCMSMMLLVMPHPLHESVSVSNIAFVISSNFSSLLMSY